MHPGAFEFVKRTVAAKATDSDRRGRVLEVGSRIFYQQDREVGSLRGLFPDARYFGIDCFEGPGVDLVVSRAHEWIRKQRGFGDDSPFVPFDVVLCCEVLEHDPHWPETVRESLLALRPEGLAIFTWATPLRAPHEVASASPDGKHYAGVRLDRFREVAAPLCWQITVEQNTDGTDGYCWAVHG